MLGYIFVNCLFVLAILGACYRPYIGVLGFYAFVFLEPDWAWRWSINSDFEYQKYVGYVTIVSFALQGLSQIRMERWYLTTFSCLAIFLGVAFISSLQTISKEYSDFYFDILLKIVVMVFVTFKTMDDPKKIMMLLWVVVICQGYNAYLINEQYFRDGYCSYVSNLWGRKGDNNLYSIFTIPVMACSLSVALLSIHRVARFLSGAIFILQVHQIMLLQSRGAMIGAIITFAFTVVLVPKNTYTVRTMLIAFILGSALAGPSVVKEFLSSFESSGTRDSSASSRFDLWSAGMRITIDYPFLGVGPYAGQVMVPRYLGLDTTAKGLHNLFFEISTGCGLPATILYLGYFLIPWFRCCRVFRHRKDELLSSECAIPIFALSIGLPGYIVSSMFSSGALLESSYVLVAMGAATLYAFESRSGFLYHPESTYGSKQDLSESMFA